MLTEFTIKSIDKDFAYLETENEEELKIKIDNLPSDLKVDDKVKIDFFYGPEYTKKSVAKKILNEILNINEKE